MGPYPVTTQEYNLGNLAFRPTDSAWASSGIELIGEIKSPTDLGNSVHPVVVLLHGRHVTTYQGGSAFLEWPPATGHQSIPSYRGYDYLGDVLASDGYIVVSISSNGINARDNSAPDAGALARAQLIQRTFGILDNLNTDGVIRPRAADATHPGTDLFTGTSSPFDTRYVGHLDLTNIGLMGHSRGGEGVVRSYNLNQSLGAPYGINAVFALAPIDFTNSRINNAAFAVLLPYNDGDVSDLQGDHFFDDSRYNTTPDWGVRSSIEVMGANHNFYNTVWTPGSGFPGAVDEGVGAPPTRLTPAQEQGTGLAYMGAFFRTYLGSEYQFLTILTGDVPPPPSARVTPDYIHTAFLGPDDPAYRRDVNRLLTSTGLTTNTLGGAVTTGGGLTSTFVTTTSGGPNRNVGMDRVGYSGTTSAFYENDLPAGARDVSGFGVFQFRVGVNYLDTRNPLNMPQDFTVVLTDGSGNSYSTLVSAWSNDLFYPPRNANPHEVLNTVRIGLGDAPNYIDLTDVRSIRLNFDQTPSGAFDLTDIAFSDPASPAPAPAPRARAAAATGRAAELNTVLIAGENAPLSPANLAPAGAFGVGPTLTPLDRAVVDLTGRYDLLPSLLDGANRRKDQGIALDAGAFGDLPAL
jgi:hypothetical protein